MKTRFNLFLTIGCLILAECAFDRSHAQAPSEKGTPPIVTVQSNAIPRSVFVVPSVPAEGRDPFFPNSVRLAKIVSKPIAPPSTPPAAGLVLNGLSGTAGKKLAIINNRTFAEGESGEVPSRTGRVLVRCIEIKDSSVTVEVSGERVELLLRSSN
jgi:hypothetical protein